MVRGKIMTLPQMTELHISSTLDGSAEPVLFYKPPGNALVPLVVGLHTWSFDRFNQRETLLPLCVERGWALLLPEFRGPNLNTNPRADHAGGSEVARQDIIDALNRVSADYPIATQKVFLIGNSGGGHMALMMAAHAPDRWRGVSAWTPITDLAAWHAQNPDYAPHIEAVCGGPPGADEDTDARYRDRSPLTHVRALAAATLSVHHGRFDNRVPYSHTWNLITELEALDAPGFYFEVFDGGHEMHADVAFRWFEALLGNRPAQRSTG
jgi:dipeptidyl aminopeptidase/acylaminoacyl peptidase